MKTILSILALIIISSGLCFARASGNIGYSQAGGKGRAEQEEVGKRALTREEMPPTSTSMFLDAHVLINVKADEYVAVFGVTQEGGTLAECAQKMDAALHSLK